MYIICHTKFTITQFVSRFSESIWKEEMKFFFKSLCIATKTLMMVSLKNKKREDIVTWPKIDSYPYYIILMIQTKGYSVICCTCWFHLKSKSYILHI